MKQPLCNLVVTLNRQGSPARAYDLSFVFLGVFVLFSLGRSRPSLQGVISHSSSIDTTLRDQILSRRVALFCFFCFARRLLVVLASFVAPRRAGAHHTKSSLGGTDDRRSHHRMTRSSRQQQTSSSAAVMAFVCVCVAF